MRNAKFLRSELCIYLIAVVICFTVMAGYGLMTRYMWRSEGGDYLFFASQVKGIHETGWALENESLGLPGKLQMYDFPHVLVSNLFVLSIKGILLVVDDAFAALNLYFLMTFPLTAIVSVFVFRQLGFSPMLSVFGSLIYSFTPYHIARGAGHMLEVQCYVIPMIFLPCVWVFLGFPLFFDRDERKGWFFKCNDFKSVFSIIACIVAGISQLYFAFFSCFFGCITGLTVYLRDGRKAKLVRALVLVFIISSAFFVSLSPSLIHWHVHGKPSFWNRSPAEAEIYGLKMTSMVLPYVNHRVQAFSAVTQKYMKAAPLCNENMTAALGLLGSVGLIATVFWGLFGSSGINKNSLRLELRYFLGVLTITGLLYATIGGMGSIFALAVHSSLRCLNRISIFIAFFSVTGLLILLEQISRQIPRFWGKEVLLVTGMSVLLLLSFFDQIPAHNYRRTEHAEIEAFKERNFLKKIKNAMEPGDSIFQLPVMAFPEHQRKHDLHNNSHLIPYLHSSELNWSYGAMKDSNELDWQRKAASLPTDAFLKTIVLKGFDGVFINCKGYEDGAKQLLAELQSILKVKPIVDIGEKKYFFNLESVKASFKQRGVLRNKEMKADIPNANSNK